LCVVKVAEAFEYEDKTVKSLVMVSAANPCYSGILEVLSQQLYQDQLTKLSQFSPQELVACFSQKEAVVVAEDDDNAAVFEIVNPHGLHARPGALLVAEAKKFKANIKVTNLDSETPTTVNAKSLMKVMTLGVKYKDKLQFVAEGEDAPQALQALGAAIAAGLGES
jgi:phosphocarrier protein FPr